MTYLLVKLIRFYQLFLSPFVGQNCRFSPTCSNYAMEAILKHGCLKGVALASKRICRCHPWSSGGIDEVPKKL
jgi:putative membrane protein insertion efficiency factor|tara:strand:- start:12141 stop:12359 length:219 start_codon:yes stop_codon:yes gene_type:complete